MRFLPRVWATGTTALNILALFQLGIAESSRKIFKIRSDKL
jgi:hypothetical protein